jgi:crotonobetainyl-CoA:carnitine CoA-transferase CaiB-like acyl-CoA transferase
MPRDTSAGPRILAAHSQNCANVMAELEAARAAGAPAAELAALEDRALAARRMYQELSADLSQRQKASRPWWRFLRGSHGG